VKWFFRRVQRRVLEPGIKSHPLVEDEGVAVEGAPHVKVRVLLDPETGWPDTESEGLWALPLTNGLFRLENTPFFAFALSNGNEISASPDDDGVLWVTGVVRRGGSLTVRIITIDRTDSLEGVAAEFRAIGVAGQGFREARLMAFDLRPDYDLPAIKKVLKAGVASGRWYYEEGDVDEVWQAL